MNQPNTGGPAFPTLAVVGTSAVSEGGITVRDYFATHAPADVQDWFEGDEIAWRWHYADLMLAERENGGAS